MTDPDSQFGPSRGGRNLDWRCEQAAALVGKAEEINRLYDDYAARGIAAHRGRLPYDLANDARALADLPGVEPDAHEAEPCHVAIVKNWEGIRVREYCAAPKRHSAKGLRRP